MKYIAGFIDMHMQKFILIISDYCLCEDQVYWETYSVVMRMCFCKMVIVIAALLKKHRFTDHEFSQKVDPV